MKIFMIIVCLLLAAFSGYLFNSAINTLKEEEIIFTKYFLSRLPPNVLKCISCSIFIFLMATFLLFVTT